METQVTSQAQLRAILGSQAVAYNWLLALMRLARIIGLVLLVFQSEPLATICTGLIGVNTELWFKHFHCSYLLAAVSRTF